MLTRPTCTKSTFNVQMLITYQHFLYINADYVVEAGKPFHQRTKETPLQSLVGHIQKILNLQNNSYKTAVNFTVDSLSMLFYLYFISK